MFAEEYSKDKTYSMSLRRAFIPSKGCLLVSADYSQMELRILAHLSKDKNLVRLLQEGGDVLRSIAATWLKKPITGITADERQRSKQMCYGILYGMGAKALADQLEGHHASEEEARALMSSFHIAFPEVQKYIEDVVSSCRDKVTI